ncbi:MAG TPA: hypothetical protein PLT09_10750 [Deltaproteobacteria bacterium]|nr:hypothetical protein [Deltaproteobacteria bacterium]
MKKPLYMLFMLAVLAVSCSSGTSGGSGSGVQELTLRQRATGTISSEGEVRWYHYRAVEANNVLQVRCTSETLRPDVDLLVTLYQVDSQGRRTIIYGDHAPEDSVSPADLTLNTFIDRPKDIYIAVRDYRDDDKSDKPFYLSVDYAGAIDGDDNFAQATALTVDADSCPTGTIGYVLDTDCYRFTSTGGIYDVGTTFSAFDGTPVQLSVALYSADGTLVDSQSSPGAKTYHLIHYLSAGEYYVLISDYGKDHFDSASTYQVCINTVDSAEAHGNDTIASATRVDLTGYSLERTITGSLDYSEDKDYYALDTPSSSSGIKVLHLGFDAPGTVRYQVSILDADATVLMTHVFYGGSVEYHTQVRIEGDPYLMVQAVPGQSISQSASYSAVLTVLDVDDDAEASSDGNDTIQTADPLTLTSNPGSATHGKVSYRGDVDWYSVTIPAHTRPQILEVFFTAPVSEVEYCVNIMGSQLLKTMSNPEAESVATNLKTSLLIPASTAQAVYTFKVNDYQDDEGYDVTYAIRADLKDIPDALPAVANGTPPYGSTIHYFSEATGSASQSVTLEYTSVLRKTFGVNTTLLDFAGATYQQDVPGTGLTTVTFPWIAGYVDYQGDQDWYLIDVQPLDSSTSWYYEIYVDMYAPASEVEYVWKFYPDRNDNRVVADRTSGYDGFIASAGDGSILANTLSIRTPSSGQDLFWVGDPWQGPAYFSISDFNYLLDQNGNENTEPDEDWGGYDTAPYYFRVTLIYHPGVSYPE